MPARSSGPAVPRRLLLSLPFATAAAGAVPASAATNPLAPTVRTIGQIPNEAVATYGFDAVALVNGRQYAWYVVNGSPASVAKVDLANDTVVTQKALSGAAGGWAVAALRTGTSFVGTFSNASLYRHSGNGMKYTNLGKPIADSSYIWGIDADARGNVYGGTSSSIGGDGHVFGWNADTEKFRDYGAALPGAAYVRAMTAHDGIIYAGTGPVATVVAIDAQTGERTDLGLPSGEPTERFIAAMRVVGTYLYVRANSPGVIYVYDLAARQWTDIKVPGSGYGISGPAPDGTVYVDASGQLVAINPETGAVRPTGGTVGPLRGRLQWLSDPRSKRRILVGGDAYGQLWRYDPKTDRATATTPNISGAPVLPQSLSEGPDGKVYIGGYQAGNIGVYDPARGAFDETLKPFPQLDGGATIGETLYLGTYSGAVIHAYDPTQPWEPGTNPRQLFSLSDDAQDRPLVMANAGGQLAVGTVPRAGLLGGALTLYDPASGNQRTWRNIVQDHSVIALAYANGVVYLGTTVWGGIDSQPTQPDGVVAAVDVATGEKLWEATPVPGDLAVSALTFGPDGMLWGVTAGTVFRLDPQTHAASVVATIIDHDWSIYYWRGGALHYDEATGKFYGRAGSAGPGTTFVLDPDTREVTELAADTRLFLRHSSGRCYWTADYDLVELTP